MSIKTVSEAQDEGRNTVLGVVVYSMADAGGFLAIISDKEDEAIVVRLSRKQADGVKPGKNLIVSGVLKKNESGLRWMKAERVRVTSKAEELSDKEASSWKNMDQRHEEIKLDVLDNKAGKGKYKTRPKPMSDVERLNNAFFHLSSKLRK